MKKIFINILVLVSCLSETIWAQHAELRSLTSECSVERENYALINATRDIAVVAAGCKIKELLTSEDQANFDVFHTDLYPILAYSDNNKGYDQSFAFALEKAERAKPYYILVVVEYGQGGSVSNFRVRMKLPQTGAFAALQTVQKDIIEGSVLDAMNAAYHADVSTPAQVAIQAGLNKLADMLANALSGRPMELNAATLDQLDFSVILSGVTLTRTGGSGAGGDYAGLTYDFGADGGVQPIMANFITAISSIGFSVQPFVTDKQNYTAPTKEFDQVAQAFKANGSTYLVLWLHYQDGTLYGKWKVNATNTEQLALDETTSRFPIPSEDIEIDPNPNPAFRSDPFLPELRGGCDSLFKFNEKWRFKPNVTNCISSFNAELNYSVQGVQLQFIEGLVFGAADGVLDLMAFLYEIGGFAIKKSIHTPFTVLWFTDLAKETARKGLFQGVKDKLKGDFNYWETTFKAAVKLFFELSNPLVRAALLQGIYESLKNYVKSLAGASGTFDAGYSWGKLIFEVVLDFFTGGSRTLARLAVDLAKETFEIFAKQGITAATQYVLSKGWNGCKNTALKLKCLLVGGCFTPDTPYRSFSGLLPLQNAGIRPNLDYILNH